MTAEKKKGGLGIKKMRTMNSALMAMLGRRTLVENNKPWAKVINSKYMKGEASIAGSKKLSIQRMEGHNFGNQYYPARGRYVYREW